jgi:hypothetical protein
MRREDVVDILGRTPEADLTKTQFLLRTGQAISLDTLIRFEPTYLVARGREAGNQDEGRGFFLPYDDIIFMKIERQMTIVELDTMFADRPDTHAKRNAGKVKPNATESDAVAETPQPQVMDPTAIAKQNLLERIRAAKSVTTKTVAKL